MKIEFPEAIDLSHPERYILMIRIHQEQYSFALYNPVVDGSFYYQTIENNLHPDPFLSFKDAFFDNEFLTLPFRKVIVVNHTPEFTFVPSLIFEEKDKETFMNLHFFESKDRVLSQKLWSPEITILHRMPEDIYEFFQRSFVHPQFIHHLSSLVTYFQDKSRVNNAHKMIVNLQEKGMDVLCFSHGEFVLGNYFHCPQVNDAIYYILYIWKQFKLDQMKDFIFVTGDASSKKSLMEELKPYLRNIIPVNITPEAHFAGIDTQNIPFELSSLTLCEL